MVSVVRNDVVDVDPFFTLNELTVKSGLEVGVGVGVGVEHKVALMLYWDIAETFLPRLVLGPKNNRVLELSILNVTDSPGEIQTKLLTIESLTASKDAVLG